MAPDPLPPRHPNQTPPGLTKLNQQRFLTALTDCGQHKQAAALADISLRQIYHWANTSDTFAKRLAEAEMLGSRVELAECRAEVRSRALAGKEDPGSTNLLMFLTKKHDPTFRDNTPSVQFNGPVQINFNIDSNSPVDNNNHKAVK